MMVVQSPFTLLAQIADPMLAGKGPNDSVKVNPIMNLIGYEPISADIQTSKAGEIDLFEVVSQPAIVVGQHRMYKAGTRDIAQGKVYLQFYTEEIWVDEDELERMDQTGNTGVIATSVASQRIKNHRFYINRVLKYAINPWNGVTTSTDYNANLIGMFMSSSTGTIGNPSDLNATAGIPINQTALTILSGGSQTYHNVERIMADVEAGFAKVDFNDHEEFPWSQMYCGTHPNTYAKLKTVHDLYNSTNARSPVTYLNDFAAMGVILVKSAHFYPDSAVSTGGEGRLFFFTDPTFNFLMMEKVSKLDAWSPWDKGKRDTEIEGKTKISYDTRRSSEIGFRAQPYLFYTAADTYSFFKALFVVRVTNFTT